MVATPVSFSPERVRWAQTAPTVTGARLAPRPGPSATEEVARREAPPEAGSLAVTRARRDSAAGRRATRIWAAVAPVSLAAARRQRTRIGPRAVAEAARASRSHRRATFPPHHRPVAH